MEEKKDKIEQNCAKSTKWLMMTIVILTSSCLQLRKKWISRYRGALQQNYMHLKRNNKNTKLNYLSRVNLDNYRKKQLWIAVYKLRAIASFFYYPWILQNGSALWREIINNLVGYWTKNINRAHDMEKKCIHFDQSGDHMVSQSCQFKTETFDWLNGVSGYDCSLCLKMYFAPYYMV